VRREDQEKINRFSSLHQKETGIEDELRAKIVNTMSDLENATDELLQKEKEDLEEISSELELVDEEDTVP
jgi:prefoldin subunit 4